jgi:hypothetical protein
MLILNIENWLVKRELLKGFQKLAMDLSLEQRSNEFEVIEY